jgi:8-oxo-dGTP pyrophosphatase MutT (NUDIX family)
LSFRPDLVECWVFRVPVPDQVELLLIRRAPDRIFPGLWQCVSGGIEPEESVPLAALREIEEETGLGEGALEAFYDLDQVEHFYWPERDELVSSCIFAARAGPDATPRLSSEHDGLRWASPEEALRLTVWPAYDESIRRIRQHLLDPDLARWFEVDRQGRRLAR